MEYEWLILADYATVVGDKLYVQGGGWVNLTVNSGFPVTQVIGIAASIVVPWNETNTQGNFEIEIQDDDGGEMAKFSGGFKAGRPPEHPPGQPQRAQLATNLPLQIQKPGTYAIIGRLEGQELTRTQFNVLKGPLLAMKERAGGAEKEPPKPSGDGD